MERRTCEKSYAVETRYSNFYCGGDIVWSGHTGLLFCLNNTEVSAVSVANAQIKRSYGVNLLKTKGTDERVADNSDEDVVYAFGLSPNNENLITAHRSGLLRLWSVETCKVLKLWKAQHKGPILKVQFSTCNRLVCSSGADAKLRLWDFARSRCHAVLKDFRGPALLLYFHPNVLQTELYVAGADHTIYCWNYETKSLLRELRGHISQVTDLAFTTNNEYLATVARDKVLILWKLLEGQKYKVIPLYEDLEAVCFWREYVPEAPELQVMVASSAGCLKLVDCSTAQITTLNVNVTQQLKHVLHYKTAKQLALVTSEHNILIYDVVNKLQVIKQLVGFTDEVLDMCLIGPEDRYLAVATNSTNIKLYDTLELMNCKIYPGHKDNILSLSAATYNNEYHFLISAGKDHSLRLWQLQLETADLNCVAEHSAAHTSTIGCISFGYNAPNILASVSQDGSMKVWELQGMSKAVKYQFKVKYAAVAHEKEINSVAFAPNNKLLATGSQDKTAKVWSSETKTSLGTLRGHRRGIWCVRFSPVDQVLLTTSGDCTMRLWDLNSLACLKTFEQDCSVLRAEFVEYGKFIISSATDGLLKLWSIKTNDCMQTLDAHEDRVWALAIPTRSKQNFYSGGADSQLVKWRDTTDEVREEALEKRQALLEDEQLLQNLLHSRKYSEKAFLLALRLDKPKTTFNIAKYYVQKRDVKGMKLLMDKVNSDLKLILFNHIKGWNTNSRQAKVANILLQHMLTDILAHPEEERHYNARHLVEVLLPYVQRHFNRMTELAKEVAFLEYVAETI